MVEGGGITHDEIHPSDIQGDDGFSALHFHPVLCVLLDGGRMVFIQHAPQGVPIQTKNPDKDQASVVVVEFLAPTAATKNTALVLSRRRLWRTKTAQKKQALLPPD